MVRVDTLSYIIGMKGVTLPYDRLAETMVRCRKEFGGHQKGINDKLRVYETSLATNWGIVYGWFFPSKNLEAHITEENVKYGAEALRQIKDIIQVGATVDIYNRRQMDLNWPGVQLTPTAPAATPAPTRSN